MGNCKHVFLSFFILQNGSLVSDFLKTIVASINTRLCQLKLVNLVLPFLSILRTLSTLSGLIAKNKMFEIKTKNKFHNFFFFFLLGTLDRVKIYDHKQCQEVT